MFVISQTETSNNRRLFIIVASKVNDIKVGMQKRKRLKSKIYIVFDIERKISLSK